jgi:hypothetical protein
MAHDSTVAMALQLSERPMAVKRGRDESEKRTPLTPASAIESRRRETDVRKCRILVMADITTHG